MYHEEMLVKFEYWCDPIVIEGVIALGVRKLLENEFPFIFSVMVQWIQMIFDIQMYHEEIQVKFEHGCNPIIIEGVIALGLRKLENEFAFIFSVMVQWIQYFLSDGSMDSMIFGIQMYH
jgi:hypothetical protein